MQKLESRNRLVSMLVSITITLRSLAFGLKTIEGVKYMLFCNLKQKQC